MTFTPTVTTQADLEEVWRTLMGPLGFAGTSLWFMAVAPDGSVVPQLDQIEDCEELPLPEQLLGALSAIHAVLDEAVPGARIAFLRSRPGVQGVDADDRSWARALYGAARAVGAPLEVVHLATDLDVWPMPADAA
jgi:hypothetical protein